MADSRYPEAPRTGASLPRLAACVAACLALATPALSACGGSGDEPESTTASSSEPAKLTDLRRELERELRKALADQADVVDVDCVIDELRTSLDQPTLEAAERAAESGDEIPKAAVDAAFDAGSECAKG